MGQHGFGVFAHRHRLARERRFGDAQILATQQAHIGRHLVARFEQHQIARHQLPCIHRLARTLAPHIGAAGQQATHRVHGFFGLTFLHKADQGVDQHHRQNHQRVHMKLQRQGHASGDQQDINQRVVKLQQKTPPSRHALHGGQPVVAMRAQPLRHGLGRQTLRRVHRQHLQHLLGALRVPVCTGLRPSHRGVH